MKRKRNRPLIVTLICLVFFYYNLFPTAQLLSLTIELSQDYINGGYSRFQASFRDVKVGHYVLLAKVIGLFIGLVGLWMMRLWGLLLFNGFVLAALWGKFKFGVTAPVPVAIDLVALMAPWVYFLGSSRAAVPIKPELQAYQAVLDEPEEDPETGERRKNPVNELIY